MAYAVAAIPVRYALERRDWQAAAALAAPAIGFPLETLPVGRGDDLFRPRARRRADRRHCRRPEPKSPSCNRWRTSSTRRRTRTGPIRSRSSASAPPASWPQAQGDDKKALELARAAADLDATMDKHPATPAAVLPARELLADLLLELNDPAAALAEYEQGAAHRPQPLPQPRSARRAPRSRRATRRPRSRPIKSWWRWRMPIPPRPGPSSSRRKPISPTESAAASGTRIPGSRLWRPRRSCAGNARRCRCSPARGARCGPRRCG